MSRLEAALAGLNGARMYTMGLLANVKDEDWFRMPPAGVSHVGWQAGHIAVAQFTLACVRIRGEQPKDDDIRPEAWRSLFGRNSNPVDDPAKYPSPNEIRAALDRIHKHVVAEAAKIPESELDAATLGLPHPIAKTNIASLLWCGHHEMVHAGQIGLLRRQLGYAPNW